MSPFSILCIFGIPESMCCALQAAGIYLPAQMETKTFDMQSHALSIRFLSSRNSALGSIFSSSSCSNLASKDIVETAPQAAADMLSGEGSYQPRESEFNQEAETEKPQV